MHGDVALAAEDATHGVGDVVGVEAGSGDLVQQRLEQVEVVGVDDGDVDGRLGEALGGGQPAESGTDDHHPMAVIEGLNHAVNGTATTPEATMTSATQRAFWAANEQEIGPQAAQIEKWTAGRPERERVGLGLSPRWPGGGACRGRRRRSRRSRRRPPRR